ncbi:MAG: N-glycosylase/DNA lyase [Candidatus Aenigmarchaeota archaeon]|nr:N-glycosylase/DNA lyase [Candidatus Aenigmarchaeota archaeon]
MKKLLEDIEQLKKSQIKNIIDNRIKEFKQNRKKSNKEIFKELCFCILTANFNAKISIEIQNKIDDGFLNLSESELSKKLSEYGHRFPNTRAHYIVEARKYKDSLKDIINSENKDQLREWLVKNIKGFGYKEASHFLRNIGFENIGIIDFHIIDILTRYKIIKKPKILTKRKYLEIEKILEKIAKKLNMTLSELDLYLWYIETGKILK